MKNLLIVIVFSLFAVISCTKKETVEPEKEICEIMNTGYVTVYNSSNNPYELYVDNYRNVEIAGGFSHEAIVSPGVRSFKLVQKSGYLFTPTIYETSITVKQCERLSWRP